MTDDNNEEEDMTAPRLDNGDGSVEMPVDLLEQIQGDWLDEDGAEISVYGDDVAVTREPE